MLRASPIVYAHRGASFELPENTLESFALALSLGADALETDAHLTRDGIVVLSHDASGERMAGVPKLIRDASSAEIREWNVGARFTARGPDERPGPRHGYRMPTFAEALEAFPGVVFNVDAKEHVRDMLPALLRVIRAANATDRVRIASFSARVLRRVRAMGYEGQTGMAPIELAPIMLLPRALAKRWRAPGDAAQVPLRAGGITFASARAIDRLHASGLRVDFWTIDDPALAARLRAMGADGVMTDDVRALCRPTREPDQRSS